MGFCFRFTDNNLDGGPCCKFLYPREDYSYRVLNKTPPQTCAIGKIKTKRNKEQNRTEQSKAFDRLIPNNRQKRHKKQVQAREHIVQGMLQALGMIDDVIEVVRAR